MLKEGRRTPILGPTAVGAQWKTSHATRIVYARWDKCTLTNGMSLTASNNTVTCGIHDA